MRAIISAESMSRENLSSWFGSRWGAEQSAQRKVGKMPANKHICHASGKFTGKYRQIMENTGKYDLQPSSFRFQ